MLKKLSPGQILSWLFLSLIIILTIVIRWKINFGNRLMPNLNGPYYLIQVRSILKEWRLGFSDLPFIFWLEALVARLLFTFKAGPLYDCIMWASKGVDSIFPAFTALPLFLLIRDWNSKDNHKLGFVAIVSAYSVLNFSALNMTSGFQKNAAGMVLLMFFIYYLYRSLQYKKWKNYVAAGIAFALIGFTHIGCFGVAVAFTLIVFLTYLLFRHARKRFLLFASGGLVFLLIAIMAILYVFWDPTRIERLLSVFLKPLKLFQRSVIFSILNGRLMPPDLANFFIINLLALSGIVLIIKYRSKMEMSQRLIVIAAIFTALFMASPLIGQEWSGRLLMMAYIPASLLLTFLFTNLPNKILKNILVIIIFLFMALSVMASMKMSGKPSISEEAYEELYKVKDAIITNPEKTLVIARHGLEWWAAWTLGTKVGQERAITKDSWEKYDSIVYLLQKAGSSNFGPAGPSGPPFPEVRIPSDADIIFEGQFFRLAKSNKPPDTSIDHGELPDVVGLIVRSDKYSLKIRTDQEIATVILTSKTIIGFDLNLLTSGTPVFIWGNWRAFSPKIIATRIELAPPPPDTL